MIATKAKIESVFGEAVSKFNDAGCVKWVPRNSETHYITVFGNEQMWVHLKGTNRDKYGIVKEMCITENDVCSIGKFESFFIMYL